MTSQQNKQSPRLTQGLPVLDVNRLAKSEGVAFAVLVVEGEAVFRQAGSADYDAKLPKLARKLIFACRKAQVDGVAVKAKGHTITIDGNLATDEWVAAVMPTGSNFAKSLRRLLRRCAAKPCPLRPLDGPRDYADSFPTSSAAEPVDLDERDATRTQHLGAQAQA